MAVVSLIILVGALHLVAYVAYNIIRTMFFSKLLKIPGLSYGPFYGNVKEAMVGEAMESSVKWVKKYGNIVRFYQLFGREGVLIADVDAIRHVLVSNSANYPRVAGRALTLLVPDGLLSLEGSTHRSVRKLLNPSFNKSAVKGFLPLFHQTAGKMNSKLDYLVKKSARVNIQKLMKSATMAVIGLAAFDRDMDTLNHEDIVGEEEASLSYMISHQRKTLLSSLPFYEYLPLAANIRFNNSIATVNKLCTEMIEFNRSKTDNESNLLRKLLTATDEESGNLSSLSNSAIRDHMLSFMVAGHETSSVSLSWLLLELSRHPGVQQTLYEEVKSFDSKSVDLDTLDSLEYLDACIKETLRLYPPAPSIQRTAKHDDVVCGYEIPAGTNIVLHMGALMRTCVEDGAEFRPERFLHNQFEGKRWLPFSIGPHACIGSKFALQEMKLFILYLVQCFVFTTVPDLVIRKVRALTVKPSPDVELIVSRRV